MLLRTCIGEEKQEGGERRAVSLFVSKKNRIWIITKQTLSIAA